MNALRCAAHSIHLVYFSMEHRKQVSESAQGDAWKEEGLRSCFLAGLYVARSSLMIFDGDRVRKRALEGKASSTPLG